MLNYVRDEEEDNRSGDMRPRIRVATGKERERSARIVNGMNLAKQKKVVPMPSSSLPYPLRKRS